MANAADRYTDKTFSQLESQISGMYREARKDISAKLRDFEKRHRAKDKDMQKKLKKGEITQAQYQQWMTGQVFVGNQWKQKLEQINTTIKNVMQEASNLSYNKSIDVFAENANYTAYEISKEMNANINFGLYDATTVSRLIKEEPELLPRKVVNGKKLEAWNQKQIANAISQGIIQGEGIDEISKRIARDTCIPAGKSSMLYARTAVTGAQNAGRVERMKEAEDLGIEVKKRWMATLDDRTRDSHQELDGEGVDVDEPFSNGLMYPGDPNGAPAEVYNCRCTLVYIYPKYQQNFERTAYLPDDESGHKRWETVGDMTYREWQKSKKETEEPSILRTRGHVDMTAKENYTKSKQQLIQQDTGMDEETAKDTAMAVKLYTTSDKYEAEMVEYQWTGHGSDQIKKYVDDLELYIKQAPKWDDGGLYRGERIKKSEFNTWQVGKTLKQDRITSWSSETKVADKFAKFSVKSDEVSVKYVLDVPTGTPTNGVSIAHLSGKSKEMEVLFGKGEDLTITSIEEVLINKSKSVFVVHVVEDDSPKRRRRR